MRRCLVSTVCSALFLFSLTLAAQEFPVNTYKGGEQHCPVVVAHPEGGYLTVFASNTFDNPSELQGIFGQRFGPSGERIGSEVAFVSRERVNCLAAVPSGPGRLLIAWGLQNGIGTQVVYARHFDLQGKPVGPRIRVGEGMVYLGPAAACDAEGRCWIAWIGENVASVRARRFDLSGQPLGEEIRLDAPGPPGDTERWGIELAADPQGGFIASWWSGNTETGTPEDPLPPPNGQIRIRRVSPAGELLGDEIALDPADAAFAYSSGAICRSAGGGFFAAASRVRIDLGAPDDILLRRFDASGAPVGSGRVVASASSTRSLLNLFLACGPDSLLLLWVDVSHSPAANGLFGRFFSLAGEPTGPPFLIANPGSGGQSNAVLLASHQVFAAWEVYRPDNNGSEIHGRTYRAAPNPLSLHGGRFKVEASFRDPSTRGLASANPKPLTDDTGLFWFFDDSNLELVVKALDGCAVNGHFWVFAAGLTDVEAEITVTDTVSGNWKTYRNPPRTAFLPIQDTRAFDCP
jgi:hypothetical protein